MQRSANNRLHFASRSAPKVRRALVVLFVDPHLPAIETPAPAADDGGVGRTVDAEVGAFLDQPAPVLAPAGTSALGAGRSPTGKAPDPLPPKTQYRTFRPSGGYLNHFSAIL
jgi:hypothetical protein